MVAKKPLLSTFDGSMMLVWGESCDFREPTRAGQMTKYGQED